jgi:hypothetical protein
MWHSTTRNFLFLHGSLFILQSPDSPYPVFDHFSISAVSTRHCLYRPQSHLLINRSTIELAINFVDLICIFGFLYPFCGTTDHVSKRS